MTISRCLGSAALLLATVCFTASAARGEGTLSFSLARYEIKHAGRAERLDVLRTNQRVEHRYLSRGVAEIWTRNAQGELSHWKVFPEQGRAVHYTAGDLRTIEAEPVWEQLATLVEPSERAKLTVRGKKRTPRGEVNILHGTLERAPAQLLWNDALGWAELISFGKPTMRST